MAAAPDAGRDNTEQARTDAINALARALLAASLAVLVLFGAYELLVHTWLQGADEALLLTLQRARGAATALIAAGVAGWVILHEGPPLLTAGPLPAGADSARLDPEQKRLHYARWFIVMRWLTVAAATFTIVLAVDVAELLPAHVGPSLLGLVASLMILNLCYSVHLRVMGSASARFLAVQVYVDLVVLVLLLHFSGGIENPLTPLMLLHVIIAGIVLGRRHAYLVAAAGSVLFALLAWGEAIGVLPHYMLTIFPHLHVDGIVRHAAHVPVYVLSRVALQALLLLLVAYFTTTLVERIRRDERQLEMQAERALAQAQTLERALDTTGTALCLCDRELEPFWANARWAEWVAAAPALSCSVRSCGSPATSTLEDGVVRTDEVRSSVAGGNGAAGAPARVYHVTTAPVRDRAGQIIHVVTLARDVTEQHAAQARALRAERLAAVGELAGQVAHEVNNPIAIISAKARLLLADTGALTPKASQELTKIAELTDRVARIAQGLLSYCRPAPGARAPLDVALPIRRALAYVEGRATASGVVVRDDLPPALPWVNANAAELEQVFLNILLNALDAMPAGGRLHIAAEPAAGAVTDGPMLRVRIADSGTGVPPELRARVFEPFLTTKGRSGSGLGLSICQGLVRSHGGEIELSSEPGAGTCVTVRLPALGSPVARARTAPVEGGAVDA